MQKVAANDMPSAAICQHVAKELPAKSFEIDSNPQKVGSEQIGVKRRVYKSLADVNVTFCGKGGTVERVTDFL